MGGKNHNSSRQSHQNNKNFNQPTTSTSKSPEQPEENQVEPEPDGRFFDKKVTSSNRRRVPSLARSRRRINLEDDESFSSVTDTALFLFWGTVFLSLGFILGWSLLWVEVRSQPNSFLGNACLILVTGQMMSLSMVVMVAIVSVRSGGNVKDQAEFHKLQYQAMINDVAQSNGHHHHHHNYNNGSHHNDCDY